MRCGGCSRTAGTTSTIAIDDPVETATLIFNAVGHTYRHMRTGHRWPAERARERVVGLVLDGLPR